MVYGGPQVLNINLDETRGIVVLEPAGRLSEADFHAAAGIIDPYLRNPGALAGIVIHVEDFPGWDSFSALVAHLKFVREHHRDVSRVAFATDSPVGSAAEKVARHFVNAEIKHFGFVELEAAKDWIYESTL